MGNGLSSDRSAWIQFAGTILAAIIFVIGGYLLSSKDSTEKTVNTAMNYEKDGEKDRNDADSNIRKEEWKSDLTHSIIKEQSALELDKYLDSLPPLQREAIFKEHYLGKWVAWTCNVRDIRSSETSSGYTIICGDSNSFGPWTEVDFLKRYNDNIEQLREGDNILYHARIDYMTAIYFILSEGEIF